MSGVKRYSFDIDERYLCDCGNGDRVIRVESGKDGYVTATDYDRLEKECERLKSIYEEDTRRLTGVNALADDLKAERDELRSQVEAMRTALIDAAKTIHWTQSNTAMSRRVAGVLAKAKLSAELAALKAKP